jgi:hypothetical protein
MRQELSNAAASKIITREPRSNVPSKEHRNCLARQKSALRSTLMKNSDMWWDGESMALTGAVIIENYPAAPAGDGLRKKC